MAQLYANENFPLPVVEELRILGHDVLTSLESGKSGQAIPDDEVLAFAVTAKRTLITLNRRHFIRLHNHHPEHFGIMVCTVDADFIALAGRIDSALRQSPELAGQLIRVNRPPT